MRIASPNNIEDLQVDGQSILDQLLPAGMVAYFAMNTPPSGWLKANGAAISRSTYSDLFSAIGTTFGSGNGSTTFNLPDLRGEFIRGWDDFKGVDSGRGFGSFQGSQNLSHTHRTGYQSSNDEAANFGLANPAAGFNNRAITTDNVPASSDQTLSSGGAEARPRNVALLACIKF